MALIGAIGCFVGRDIFVGRYLLGFDLVENYHLKDDIYLHCLLLIFPDDDRRHSCLLKNSSNLQKYIM